MNIPSRRTLVGTLTVGALLGSGGCSMLSPDTVLGPGQQLSDGVSAQVGDVEAQSLVVVGSKGRPGVLSGAIVNPGPQPVTVQVSAAGSSSPTPVQVPAGSSVTLGGAGSRASVVIPTLDAEAGATTSVQLSTPAGGQVQVQVPVLPTTFDYYSTVTPSSGATPSSVPGVTSSPSATDTQQPTTSPS